MNNINIEILFEDEHIIVVNKPANMLVHPYKAESNDRVSVMKCLRNQIDQYVYPVHRLDRAVTGALLFTKSTKLVTEFQNIWHTDLVKKKYLALTRGIFEDSGFFDFALKDKNKIPKEALTYYHPLELFKTSTLVEVEIKTGRMHQIRRHFSRTVQHLLGDRKYGKKKYNDDYLERFGLERIFLHSHKLDFEHPITGQKLKIEAPLAQDLQNVLIKMEIEHIKTLESNPYTNYGK